MSVPTDSSVKPLSQAMSVTTRGTTVPSSGSRRRPGPTGPDPPSASAAEFKQALRTHFPRLAELQARARTLSERLGGPTPVAPDLWLLANGEHRFIEVKLPGDYLRSPQYAGLALLAAHLPSALPIAVSVITLDSSEDQFAKLTQILRR